MFLIEQQGQVFKVTDTTAKPPNNPTPPKRGQITVFSENSRRRLIDLLARMDDSYKRCTFVTLTFHNAPTVEEAQAALKRLLAYIKYWFPEVSAVWRKELQDRGAIHFHLLCFNLPFIPQAFLQDRWIECTGEVLSIVHIKLVKKFSTYMSYISKYIAKVDTTVVDTSLVNASYQQKPSPRLSGRHWGYHNKKALPLAPLLKVVIDDEELGSYASWSVFALSNGKASESHFSRKLYSPDAYSCLLFVLKHARLLVDLETVQESLPEVGAQRKRFGGLGDDRPAYRCSGASP